MNTTRKKILLAVDGSGQSLDAVRYVGKVLASQKAQVVLFIVIRKIDEAFYEMGIDPFYSERIASIRAWEREQNEIIEDVINRATQILMESGIPRESVTETIHQRKIAVAGDILIESKNDYSAVVVGRTGLSKLKDFVFGSIADKLIETLTHVPVWVVGGNPEPDKILVALDASKGSMQAVEHVGMMLGGANFEVTLLHAVRGLNFLQQIDLSSLEHEELLREIKKSITPVFNEAKNRLINAGLKPEQITTKLLTDVDNPADAIVQEAGQGNYGTIAVGRRGLSKVEGFFTGSISKRILHLAKETAVWVVS
ncbi:MAG: universal stress protein [Deltaproteobacteria bacterium]|nr:universal stress protein [Deltaproteobacteria bacterium]MBW2011044.1 universal stress protein [Deltaproteobacteria bacterium]MBW2100356.1 universal stress protein [Deltaproteobacteria bacterium]